MPDTKHLELRRGTGYAVVLDVPRALVPIIGRKRLRKGLGTRDLSVARRKRHDALAEFHRRLDEARAKLSGDAAALAAEALEWRRDLARLSDDPRDRCEVGLTPRDVALDVLQDQAQAVEDRGGDGRGFFDAATGRATPLLAHREEWLAFLEKRGKSPSTVRRYGRSLDYLGAWLRSRRLPETVEAVSRPEVARFVRHLETLAEVRGGAAPGLGPGTVNNRLNGPSSYWGWLEKFGHIDGGKRPNPFLRQRVPRDDGEEERAFTDDEVLRLLNGPADQNMQDVMRLLALSGLRVEELFRQRVANCRDGIFLVEPFTTETGAVWKPKNKQSKRRFPIHSGLSAIVSRLCADRPGDAYLIEKGSRGHNRSAAKAIEFVHYRRSLGVEARVPGRRRSLVNLHSWRRWFITTAERAGTPESTVKAVVGHERPGVTFGLYSDGPSDEQLWECVEAVRLPGQGRPAGTIFDRAPVLKAPLVRLQDFSAELSDEEDED